MRINEVFSNFNVQDNFNRVELCDYGHINDTYIVYTDTSKRYVLQRINRNVFSRIDLLMSNIEKVTEHLQNKIKRRKGEERECLHLIRTKDLSSFCWHCDDNSFWRMYDYVENTKTLNKVDSPKTFFEVGRAFGQFQKDLDDFDAKCLYDTIPDFHNTKKRLTALSLAVKADPYDRVREIKDELKFVERNKNLAGVIVDALREGKIPKRVTHNDTKLNNILLDIDTSKAVCVIDLDTVMCGAGVYDFGDAIRSGCNKLPEGEKDLNMVGFDLKLFKAFAEGFIGAVGKKYNKAERDLLVPSCFVMTYELAVRFLTDYILGDVYFKTKYDKHNLDRARIQIKLFNDMRFYRIEMEETVKNLF